MKNRITAFLIILFVCALSPHPSSLLAEEVETQGYKVDGDVKDFLEDFKEAIDEMDTYTFLMSVENWEGKRHEKMLSRFCFKKPNLIRMEVLEGRKRGSTVVLNKEGSIRGRNNFGLTLTLKPHNKRLQNIRGGTFLRASLADKWSRINDQITNKGCRAKIKEEELGDREVYHLHIYHNNTYNDATDEDLWVDKETFFISKNVIYVDDKVVSDVNWSQHEANIPLDDSLFKQ
ncbi:MAG: hypothetical protein ABH875_07190 [Candidatus Omnitrophota bacterium]